MNEKFGFLSNFTGIKVKPKKKSPFVVPKHGELTDNPPAINIFLTDDDDSDEEPEVIEEPQPKVINRILESSSSSSIFMKDPPIDPDRTYCSVLEKSKVKMESLRKSSSEPLFSSSHGVRPSFATVAGEFSDDDDELCSKMSEIHVATVKPAQKTKKDTVSDTVVGAFSDTEESVRPKKLADTILHSSSDESEEPIKKLPRPPQPKSLPKTPLPDTIVGFSESMSELSIHGPAPVPRPVVVESTSSDCSVITVSDSDEEDDGDEVSEMNDNDHPPLLVTGQSFLNCSSVASSNAKVSAESDTTVNRFFNNPPSADPQLVVSHSIIQKFRENPIPVVVEPVQEPLNSSLDRFQVATYEGKLDQSVLEDVELAETDESDLNVVEDPKETDESTEKSQVLKPSQKSRRSSTSNDATLTDSSQDQSIQSFKISTKININFEMKLSVRESCGSSDSNESSSSDESDDSPPSPKQTPKRAKSPEKTSAQKKGDSTRKEKQGSKPGSALKTTPKVVSEEDYKTPTKSLAPPVDVIDEDLQKMLDSLYGETWKTPQLLRSCKSKTVRQDLRKSIHANNFDNFVKNLPRDFESTRIGTSSSDEQEKHEKSPNFLIIDKKKKESFVTPEPKKTASGVREKSSSGKKQVPSATKDPSSLRKDPPSSSKKSQIPAKDPSSTSKKPSSSAKKQIPSTSKKTPAGSTRNPAKSTPRYLQICDSDTPSEDESSDEDFNPNEKESSDSTDDDFNPNDTWNASSDEEYEDEISRIKKRSMVRRTEHREEIVFVADEDKEKKLEEVLDRFEYKKPPAMPSTNTPAKKHSKRKLFTHSHYDEDLPGDATLDDEEERKIRKEKENDEKVVNVPEFPFIRPISVKKPEIALPTAKVTPKIKTPTPKTTLKPVGTKFVTYSFLKSLDVEANQSLCHTEALYYRKNYKSKRGELTEKLFKLYDEKVFDGKLSAIPVKWNKKLTNTAGRCNNCRRGGERQSQLELSEKVLTSADRLRCTLIHEMCHAATWILNGENGHGATWKRWAAKANSIFPELPKINVCHDYAIEYKYTYQCTNCKAKYQAHSKSKKVENIRCSICRGSIELFLNKKNKDGQVVMTPVAKDIKGFPKFVKINYKEVKQPNMTHKEVMQILSQQFACLSVEEKQNL